MSYSFLDMAYEVLQDAENPLTCPEIWQIAGERKYTTKLSTSGKTPWASLGAQMYVDVRDNSASRFVKVGKRPARFFLRERESALPNDIIDKLEKEELKKPEEKVEFKERDIHPLLTYFAYTNPAFNKGRPIYTKTIFHEKSTKSGYNEWVHPDMVGFYLPLEDWRPEVVEFNRVSDNNSLRLFSFELKRSLTKANYREAFFQAVSNSSWAHEGYLAAASITQDDEFLAELERLASSFGVGIIHIDPHDIDSSSILYPARARGMLDWETINKLSEQNCDFRKFLQDVKIDFESKRVHRAEYDDIQKDIRTYIKQRLKIDAIE